MGDIRVGQLYRKRIVRNTRGDIIDMSDEADGGVIISKGRVVNQEKWDEIQRKEHDKREAAKAAAFAVNNPNAPVAERNAAPGKVDALEKKVQNLEAKMDAQDTKLDAILAAITKK